ncbi:MAG: response regulator [Acidobacteriota bacterium]
MDVVRLLLVGPRGIDRDVYVSTMTDCGFHVETVETALAAAERLADNDTPDAIVLDLLPEPNQAWAFIARVRAECFAIPLVILTALIRPDRANRQRARELGCAAFVAKPCAPDHLVEIVCRTMAGERGLEVVSYSR